MQRGWQTVARGSPTPRQLPRCHPRCCAKAKLDGVQRRHAVAEDCRRQALAAARQGMGHVDGSPQQQAPHRAEEALAPVMRARQRTGSGKAPRPRWIGE